MVDVGYVENAVSRAYDIINLLVIVINLLVSIALTFEEIRAAYAGVFSAIEAVTIAFFALDYLLRVWTSDHLYPKLTKPVAALRYIFSFAGLIDLISFLPYYLPSFYPAGTAAFRLFRIVRVFKLFRIGAYSDSLSIIKTVIYNKRQQLYSSMFIIVVLMVGSSLCMYSAEHAAQPEVFKNAFSGLWWSGSTLLTVGYGDIYPVTTAGRLLGTLIAFLGVGAVAVPTGIISAGFIEQYSEVKEAERTGTGEAEAKVLRVRLTAGDVWSGKKICDIVMPGNLRIAGIVRNNDEMEVLYDTKLEAGDIIKLKASAVGKAETGNGK